MGFRSVYLHVIFLYSEGQGQGYAHFNSEYHGIKVTDIVSNNYYRRQIASRVFTIPLCKDVFYIDSFWTITLL